MLDFFCFLNFTFYIGKTVSETLCQIDNLTNKIVFLKKNSKLSLISKTVCFIDILLL